MDVMQLQSIMSRLSKPFFARLALKPPRGYEIVAFKDLKKFLKVLIDDIYFSVGSVVTKRNERIPNGGKFL